MYKIELQVNDKDLTNVVTAIGGVAPLTITPVHVPVQASTPGGATQVPHRLPKTRARRVSRRRRAGTTGTDLIRSWINSYGVPPFRSGDLADKAKEAGITAPSVYRILRQGITNGTLKKVGPGLYQRTGASFSQTLGGNESQAQAL